MSEQDIVERLRETAAGGLDEYGVHCEIEAEAADEIERLRVALQKIADLKYDHEEMVDVANLALKGKAA